MMGNPREGKRTIISMKQYLILKTIEQMGGKDIYLSQIVARTQNQVTWAYTIRVINELHKKGIINAVKKGRLRVVELTEKGRRLIKLIDEIVELLKPIE